MSIFRCELTGNSDDFDCSEFLIEHFAIISMVDCCNESERDVMSSRNWFFFKKKKPNLLTTQKCDIESDDWN